MTNSITQLKNETEELLADPATESVNYNTIDSDEPQIKY